jgi:GNAT superfamily N-acetyltransferase
VNPVIRAATKDDRALIKELRAEFEAEVPFELWDDDDADYEWTHVLLADENGMAALDKKSEKAWLLDILYVKPEARGSGLGVELIRAAAEYVQSQGAETLALEVLESNAGAKRLYDRLGFATIERTLAAPVAGLVAAKAGGPTFGFVHVQNDDVEKVKRDAAKVLLREPELQPGDSGWTRVAAEPDELRKLARELSFMNGVSVALGLEDGAVVRYVLFDNGTMVDEYLSVPEYFGELPPGDVYALGANPTVVARLTNADPARVRAVARTASSPAELPPAQELYEQIAAVFGVQP